MKKINDLFLNRRSVREFTDEKISEEEIELLLHASMSGPSACNRKPWEFYVIKDEKVLEELRFASPYTNIFAPLAIVVCGNLSKALPLQLSEFWIQDASAASENILLCACDLKLGSVWCGIYPQKRPVKKVSELLNLPNKHIPLNIIYIGHPLKAAEPRDQYDEKRIHIIG